MDSALFRRFALRYGVVFSVLFSLLFAPLFTAYAGFGITPPYVNNERLTRGTVYEQKITLVRSDPTDDLKAQITMNIPGIESWFSVDRGLEFILPKGTTQIPIVVRVEVPKDAEYKKYEGTMRIRTSPVNPEAAAGGVSIALGAQVDVDIEVVDKILDFSVRKIRIADLEEGRRKWGLFFPGKIRFFVTVENTGNVAHGPTAVQFDIYDANVETLLETTRNTNTIKKVEPFAIEEVVVELPTRLSAGRYKAKYSIFNGETVVQQNEINVSISSLGAVLGYAGYGFEGLSLSDTVKVVAAILVPLLVLAFLVAFVMRLRKRARGTPTPRRRRTSGGSESTTGRF